jgi:anaerobic selenocysteine-containing dehydrogenase
MPIFVPSRADFLSRPDWVDPETRVLNITRIGEILNDPKLDPPIKSLMVWNANPLSQAPDANKVAEGLAREDLFTIVSEQFMTDTARYADLVLPATMAAEQDDLQTSWGHFYINLNIKAIEPPGEAIPNVELFRRLAARMGFDDDPRFTLTDVELLREALDWDAPLLAGQSYDTLLDKGTLRLSVPPPDQYAPHSHGSFPTPSGKCEFVSDFGAQRGFIGPPLRQGRSDKLDSTPINRVPDYTPNIESDSGTPYPLQLLSPKSHGFLNSEYANEPHKVRVQGEQAVMINPSDAVARGIGDGDEVEIRNDRGKLIGTARVSDKVLAGTVVAHFGYWTSQNKAGAANALTAARTGFAGAPGYYDVAVELAPVDQA